MALQVKDGLAMRWTKLLRKLSWSASAVALAWAAGPGCHRLPYIDQSKTAPHDALASIAEEDKEVKQANFVNDVPPADLPKIPEPRTVEHPDAEELWQLTLPDAIRIALDNAELIRLGQFGAGLRNGPDLGFVNEPNSPGPEIQRTTNNPTVYDPAIQETEIASALSAFDAQFQTSLFWGRNVNPVNNGIQAGQIGGPRFPVIFDTKTSQFQVALQKRIATGGVLSISETITNTWSNNSFNAFPSAYTAQSQFQFVHPLLGGDPQNPSGLQANRAPIVIARLRSDQSVWDFKNQIIQLVRSVEQSYWELSASHLAHWSIEEQVKFASEIQKREAAELAVGRGTIADLAEADEQLESAKTELITATARVVNAERVMRIWLGLPPSDHRRIIPATDMKEARVEPDWQASLGQMIAYHPDIVSQQLAIRVSELQLLASRNQLLPRLDLTAQYGWNGLGRQLDQALGVQTGAFLSSINPQISRQQTDAGLNVQPARYRNFENWQVGLQFQYNIGNRSALASTRQSQFVLLRSRAILQEIVHRQTHTLARYYIDVDTAYKIYKATGRRRAAAWQRLEVQRARYEVGEVTIDRYLDAVNRWAQATSLEASALAQYNVAIINFEEAKGTLLAYNNIAVMEGPYPAKAYIQARDQQMAHIQHSVGNNGPSNPQPVVGDYNPDSLPPMAAPEPDQPQSAMPPLPAPVGPLGPPPTLTVPRRPVGYPEVTSDAGAGQETALPVEINVRPASASSDEAAGGLPPLP